MLSNISDQTGATGNEINNLHKLQYLSNLSLEDAYNRYNAYHGLFFTDRDATRATTLKKATKGMSEVEKRDFAAAMLAKDEINHYTHSSLKDRQLLTEYLTKQNQDRNLGITPEDTEEKTTITTEQVEPIVTHFDNEYDATIDRTNKVKSELDKQIQDTQATINILKNNPANTVKFLPKELKKEVAKLGYTKVLTKYQTQLDDLTNQNQLADITIQKAEVDKKLVTATEEKRGAVKQAIDDVTDIYAKIKQELQSQTQIITDENGKQRKVVTLLS